MKTIFIAFTFLILLLSCKSDRAAEPDHIFPASIKLAIEQYPTIEPNYDYLLDYIDSVLIVVNFQGTNSITLYNRFNLRPILTGVTFGKGPNEVITPTFLFTDKDNREFSILDSSSKKVLVFSLDSILRSSSFISQKSISLPTNGGFNFPVFPMNNSDYVAVNFKQNGHFLFFDSDGEILRESGSFPVDRSPANTPDIMAGALFEGRYEINEARDRIFKAYLYFNEISIFDVSGRELNRIQTAPSYYENIQFENGRLIIEGSKFCYVSTYLGDEYFYALYHGGPSRNSPEVLGNEIHVFDTDGVVVKRLALEVPITDLAVDEENGIIYGINYTSGKPLAVYK